MTSWTALFGSDQLDLPQSIALDNSAQQNIFVTGYTTGGIGNNTNQGNNDVLLARYNRDGTPNFIDQFGTPFADFGHEIEIDDNNKIFIVGETEGSLGDNRNNASNPDDPSLPGNADPFFVRYDDEGRQEFAIQFGSSAQDTGRGLALDNANNTVLLSGATFGDINQDEQTTGTAGDAWVGSYSSIDGSENWLQQIGTDQEDQALDVAVDRQGNVYVVGFTEGSLEEEVANAGDKDAWLAKYSPAGELLWVDQLGTEAEDQATSVAVDNGNNIFVTGFTRGDITGEEDNFINEGESDIWVAKYNPEAQNPETIIQYGSFGQEFAYDVTTDGEGRVYIAATSDGNIKGLFPGFEPYDPNAQTFLINVTRLNNDLDLLNDDPELDARASQITVEDREDNDLVNMVLGWSPLADQARGVAVDNENDVFFTGETFGPADFPPGGTGTVNAGRADGFVTRIGDEFLAQEDDDAPQQEFNPVVETAQFILINDSPLPIVDNPFQTEVVRSFQNSPVSFDVNYDVRAPEDEALTGLGLRLHYNSAQLEFDSVDDLFEDGLINASITPTADENDLDGDPNTDQFVQFAWADPTNNWPGEGTTPQELFRANFTTTLGFRGTTDINFTSSSTASGLQLSAQPLQVQIGRESTGEDDLLGEINEKYTFDVDGNEEVDALTDGLQILRNLFGLEPATSAIAQEGTRNEINAVSEYLNLSSRAFDIDGDGTVSPLTDGILISRFAFGITGESLISGGVLGQNATRNTSEAIINYIDNYLPEIGEA